MSADNGTCQRELAHLTKLASTICETPSPTFHEQRRAKLIARLLDDCGLLASIDEAGNVTAPLPGGTGHRLLVVAHLDTVFPEGTSVHVRTEQNRLTAPGIGDNSASLAVLIRYAQRQAGTAAAYRRPRTTLAATVGEEGLGDLLGMRTLMKSRRHEFDAVVALDGHLGTVVSEAVGSQRFEFVFTGRGGHSWGDFPSPSAVHAMGDAIAALNAMRVPSEPRSAFNVGTASGGTSVNAIAERATMSLDLRSVDPAILARLADMARQRVERAALQHNVDLNVKRVGDRPAAQAANQPLVEAAQRVLQGLGIECQVTASSTDANAAMAAGLPAIAFGVYKGGDAHRLSEWIEPSSLPRGYRAFENLLAALADIDAASLGERRLARA